MTGVQTCALPTIARLEMGGGLGHIEDTPLVAYVASIIVSLKYSCRVLKGLEDVLKEAIDLYEGSDVQQITQKMETAGTPQSLKEFFIAARKLEDIDPTIKIVEILAAPEETYKKLQHRLGSKFREIRAKKYKDSLFEKGDSVGVTMWDSMNNPQSIAWLLSAPTSSVFQMAGRQFLTALRIRFRMDLPGLGNGVRCDCKVNGIHPLIDSTGNHLSIKCKFLNGTNISTHNGVVQDVMVMCRCAGVFASTHFPPPFQCVISETSIESTKKIGDIMIYNGAARHHMLDARLHNPVNAHVERGGYREVGDGARAGEMEKERKFRELCDSVGIDFTPVVIETFGRWGTRFEQFFKQTISAMADNKKIDASFAKNYWEKRISMSVQKGLADSINAKIYRFSAGRIGRRDESAHNALMIGQSESFGSSGAG